LASAKGGTFYLVPRANAVVVKESMKYVVDTSIINKLVDEKIDPSELPIDGEFIASHIQIDELNKTKNAGRRAQLLKQFVELDAAIVQTESIVLGSSKFAFAKFGDGLTVQALKSAIDARNHSKKNNANDALIGELAIKKGFTLLTADRDLRGIARWTSAILESFKDLTIPYFSVPALQNAQRPFFISSACAVDLSKRD
jgi:predicted nucleic acid-binding protein